MSDTPHRPPKYVEGHYKPHFGDPDADYAIYVYSVGGPWEVELSPTDPDGDAAGVVRRDDGTPRYEGGGHIAGHVYGDEIQLSDLWVGKLDRSTVRECLDEVDA